MGRTLLPRVLREDSFGRDVIALQRALRQAGFRSRVLPIHRRYGPNTVKEVAALKRKYGLSINGAIFGEKAFNVLYPYYDAYGLMMLRAVSKAMQPPALTARQQIVQTAFTTYRFRDSTTYTEGAGRWSGIENNVRPPSIPPMADCSSMVTWDYWVTEGKGPDFLNGTNWSAGFTGSMTQHGHVVSYDNARPGDLVFYGSSLSNISHVALYVGNGRVISNGTNAGPQLMGIDYWVGGRQQIRSYLP